MNIDRFWKWVDDNIIWRDMPRLDALLTNGWFVPGLLVAILLVFVVFPAFL